MFYCYINYSPSLDKFYVGIAENVAQRIIKHNTHAYGKHRFTSPASDWVGYLSISCKSHVHATRVEKHIKKMKSRKYLINLKKYPEMVAKLVERFE